MNIRTWIPPTFKKHIRLWQRRIRDRRSGAANLFATQGTDPNGAATCRHTVHQPFLPTSTLANKQHNIALATATMQHCYIAPGQIFSFWQCAGEPTAAQGYRNGRNIVGSKLLEEPGGGLCQLSSILYYAALTAGLDILERYPHTYDIYWDNEAQRYTPPGGDATVVYGYKDLRFQNNLPFGLTLSFEMTDHQLSCHLQAAYPIPSYLFRSIVHTDGSLKHVDTWIERPDHPDAVTRSVYRKMPTI
jgi:vancomycin resistance protein VanW